MHRKNNKIRKIFNSTQKNLIAKKMLVAKDKFNFQKKSQSINLKQNFYQTCRS